MSRRLDRTTCEETFRRLDDYLDRQLTPEEARLIEEHLHDCAACSREFTFESGVISAVRTKLRRLAAPPGLLDRITEEISRSVRDERDDEGPSS
jgi:anti-sigma factor (TIGR02949 family)